MIDGFFRIAFTGASGSGFGVLVLYNEVVAGADVAGATYNGSYKASEEADKIEVNVTMAAPAGVTPVQTGIPLAAPISVPIVAKLKIADISEEKMILLSTPLGPVNVIFKKLSGLALNG